LRAILKAMTRDRSPEENRKIRWGDLIIGFIRCLWRNNLAPQLEELVEIARTYCPDLCPVGA
jgi:hypothetical protein